ncbi:hypothetical protein ScalyP_jg7716 [Parmales sp. scaly parma]|nr:hypothetical protein ScalyP_jg7716 [Parmales sp. scaly parma]
MKSHNGKPVLINKSGQLTICEDKSYEMRINVHKFAFLARKILFSLQPNFKRLSINVGFTIEGRHDRELPECLLGCANLSNFDHQKFL